jgi:YD repeat-containing protein
MPQITARDTTSGKTVTFNWNGAGNPTDEDLAEVFKAAGTHAGEAPPMDARGSLPGMHKDYPRTSVDDPAALELNQSLEGVAHPQGAGDMASLLIPSTALGTGYRALRGYLGAAKNLMTGAAEGAGTREGLKKIPSVLRGMLKTATDPISGGERAFQQAPLAQQMESLPAAPAPVTARTSGPPIRNLGNEAPEMFATPAAAPTPVAAAAPGGLSAAERAALAKQGYTPDLIEKIAQQETTQRPVRGQLRASESPLQQPRVAVGAEQVGRTQGLTKEQVRQQTAPILGEAQGEASPILPREALGRIVDTVKALPPEAREAYVAKATSGKAQWQIENIRRTLEHLGLLVGATTGVGALRAAVMKQIVGQTDPQP